MKKIILFMLSPCWEQLPCSVPIISNTDRCGRKNERKPASSNVSIPFGCTSSEKKPVLIKHYDYREMSHSYTWLVEKFSCWVKLSLRLTESQQEVRRGFGNVHNAIFHSLHRRKRKPRIQLALGYIETFVWEMQKPSTTLKPCKCSIASVMFLLAMY